MTRPTVDPQRIIERLNRIGVALSTEEDSIVLQERVLRAAKDIIGCDGGTMYAINDRDELTFEVVLNDSLGVSMGSGDHIVFPPIPLHHADGSPNVDSVVANAVLLDVTINIPDAYDAQGFDFSGTRMFDERTGYRSQSFLTVPMRKHDGEIMGVMQLINAMDENGTVIPFSGIHQSLAESLASQAATAVARRQLIADMRELFQSLIRMIADAIDAKSPFTGGHCRRVPELAMLLADAASAEEVGPLADFTMDEAQREQLSVAAWLHDCGKLATPDWILDKATKLQALCDRVELIELRAEILIRDAELEVLRAAASEAVRERAQATAAERGGQLADAMAFIHRTNRGGEFMDDEAQNRVADLAAQEWQDRDGHRRSLITPEEAEVLQVRRGTLSERERHIINDHIRVTIDMLRGLPFPRHLARVPEIAGAHHERMDGSGYPAGLAGENLSIEARVMCIADIFEALTASDRPYKQPMPLSKALAILADMVQRGHLDRDLFTVFLRRGVYRTYARRFLSETQVDEVDIAALLDSMA